LPGKNSKAFPFLSPRKGKFDLPVSGTCWNNANRRRNVFILFLLVIPRERTKSIFDFHQNVNKKIHVHFSKKDINVNTKRE